MNSRDKAEVQKLKKEVANLKAKLLEKKPMVASPPSPPSPRHRDDESARAL